MTTDTTSTALEKMNERLQDFIKHYDGHKGSIPPPEVQMDPIRVDYAEQERLERDAGKTGRSQDEIYRPGDLEKGYWGISERKIRDFFSVSHSHQNSIRVGPIAYRTEYRPWSRTSGTGLSRSPLVAGADASHGTDIAVGHADDQVRYTDRMAG